MIYFDNSATTKPYPEALATYTEVASKIWGNPSSLHNLGSQATRILEASRKPVSYTHLDVYKRQGLWSSG